MAIINCTQCGKPISSELSTCPNCGAVNTSSKKGSPNTTIVIIAAAIMAMLVAGVVLYNRNTAGSGGEIEKTEPLFKRDEPTKGQIYQQDYRDKVKEMLDSGKGVHKVSKETGIRVDEVRKIKKAHKEDE